jgi:hypothetical protein
MSIEYFERMMDGGDVIARIRSIIADVYPYSIRLEAYEDRCSMPDLLGENAFKVIRDHPEYFYAIDTNCLWIEWGNVIYFKDEDDYLAVMMKC